MRVYEFNKSLSQRAVWANKKSLKSRQEAYIIKALKATGAFSKNANVRLTPRPIETNILSFDFDHINIERGHNITEEEAKEYITNALFSVSVWNGRYKRYYGEFGATYVDVPNKKIRTSFSRNEFDQKTIELIEVYNKWRH